MSDAETIPPSRRGGKRAGAGSPGKPLNEQAKAAIKGMHPAFRRCLQRLKALGATNRQVIFELHARQGRPLSEVAQIMELDLSTVWRHWDHVRADIAANAPTTPEQFTAIREEIAGRLMATIEATHARAEIVDEATGKETTIEMPADSKMLAVRLKALDQLAKLYGVNLEQQAPANGPTPYQAPEEVAARVTEHLRLMYAANAATDPRL